MNDRMAEGVEGAQVVLVCFSKKYQDSTNCKKGKLQEYVLYIVTYGGR